MIISIGKNHCSSALFSILPAILLCGLLLVALQGCGKPEEPIQLGFIGTLSGKYSDLCSDVLAGVLLAIDEANAQGGVNGRQVTLVVKDDGAKPDQAITAAQELADLGINTIIGPGLSSVAVKLVPWCNDHNILLVSPTVSTARLAGLDDALIRIMPHNGLHQAKLTAGFMSKQMHLKNGVIFYDQNNEAYSRDIVDLTKKALKERGVKVADHPFIADKNFDYGAMVRRGVTADNDFVYLVSSALDTAMFCWQLKKQQLKPAIFVRSWALTDELYRIGNEAVEGVILYTSGVSPRDTPSIKEFRQKMQGRTPRKAERFMMVGYEATQIVLTSLSAGSDSLKQTILTTSTFQGVQDELTIDRFGDVQRPMSSFTIKGGKIVMFTPQTTMEQ